MNQLTHFLNRTRDFLWGILNDPKDPFYIPFLSFITILILASVGLLFVETFSDLAPETVETFRVIDNVILTIFAFEFLARLWVIRNWRPTAVKLNAFGLARFWVISRLRFVLSPWGFIDFLALLPIVPFLRSLRVLRLLRLFRSVRLFRSGPINALLAAFASNSLLFAVAGTFVAMSVIINATMFFFAEYGHNAKIKEPADALWWSFVTITTVGYGDVFPITTGGRVIGAVLMISGLFVIALFAGVISSTLVDQLMPLRQEQVRMSSITDHIIIAGWNDGVPMLLRQLEDEYHGHLPTVIIFAPINRPEGLDPRYLFVHGDFTKEEEYEKVRLPWARTVVVVADSGSANRAGTRDAATVLTIFTIRSLERQFTLERRVPLHICVEILYPENVPHATTAGADEVLATALVGNSLLAHTAVNPGVSPVLNILLLTARDNIYTSHIPVGIIQGKTLPFDDLQDELQINYKILLIGIVRAGEVILNPDRELPIVLNDQIIYIGDEVLPSR